MKQTFLTAALLTGLALTTAPSAHAQGIRFGLKAGANYSNLAGDLADEDLYDSKFGVHGGFMVNLALTDDGFLSVQPELLYSQKGYQYNGSQLFGTYKYSGKVRYDYLDVPVLLRIKADNLFFEAGPQYSYLINVNNSSQRTITVGGLTVEAPDNYNQDLSNTNRNEFGYVAGLGYQSDAGALLGLRYNGAFGDIAKNDTYWNGELRNARNSVFQLYLGYMFGGK
ncbi:PorT family protein [Hymenobacter gummosus]|uniref:PorT family protein n=1 Tax=Hymenobacter gummosus TaxID=1776032 RepID=A0A431U8R0_9BACT|nr:porin family protein [Hymenobacter gummosus]RTQ53437.1 PorT family protein [Hymenobacter gummosus]